MAEKTATLDLSLNNVEVYAGCAIEEIGGRLTLTTRKEEAINIIGRNARTIVDSMVKLGVEELTLTGATAIWVYLVVFHLVVHRFKALYYDDGKPSGKLRISAHP